MVLKSVGIVVWLFYECAVWASPHCAFLVARSVVNESLLRPGWRSALSFEDDDGGEEEAGGTEGKQDDGVAVGPLGGWWSGGGVVLALGAALGAGDWSSQ